ncbi:MAG: glycosyltransferase [Actinomycetota bacterium]|nr:glycosyltransferase [Actinomycetota bacterium]
MTDLAFYIPIGILGVLRWMSWFIRRVPAALYRPCSSPHREPITVVTPVYQEDPDIFRAAVESWLANRHVAEVVCVIDVTDTTCMAIAAEYPVTVLPTTVPGKRPALKLGWEHASTDLVALVDSDTIWAADVSDRVCEPFIDPQVGGVGTRQNVYNPEGLLQRVNDIYLDGRYFDENAGQTYMGQAVSCLSGRTAVYRRRLLVEHSDEFMEETFLGVPCNSGDDKRLTSLILRDGYRTFMQRSARVWSTFPSDAPTFFRQRLRWSRNTWRSDLRALGAGWVFKRPFLAFTMLDKAVSSFTLLVSPAYLLLALYRADWLVALALVNWWLVSRGTKILPHLRRRPRDLAILPFFIGLTFVMAVIKIYALTTIRAQRWLTRDVAVVDGSVVRTDAALVEEVPA